MVCINFLPEHDECLLLRNLNKKEIYCIHGAVMIYLPICKNELMFIKTQPIIQVLDSLGCINCI